MITMKCIPTIDGLRVDQAHKGGGLKKLVKKVTKGTVKAITLGQDDLIKDTAKGITGIAAKEAAEDAAKAQEKEIAKQEAIAAKQQEEIDRKRRLADSVAAERKARMGQNQLLSGSETGVVSGSNNLLGIS